MRARNMVGSLLFSMLLAMSPALASTGKIAVEPPDRYLSSGGRKFKVLGNPEAPRGGTLRIRFPGEPPTLNPIISDGYQAVEIQFYVIEALLAINDDTSQWQPWLADQWSISPDGKTFEFKLRENAVWSDGRPVTSEDVKFSFDVIFDDRYPTAHMRPYYEFIEKVEIVDRKRVRFVTKDRYFGNFISSAGLPIVPKHVFGDPETGPHIHDRLIGTGPYVIEKRNPGRNIILKKNPRWWGHDDPLYRFKHPPERVVFQFVMDDMIALEMLKRGELDYIPMGTETYLMAKKQLAEAPAGSQPFFLEKVENSYPYGVSSVGLNMRNDLFKDRRVRLALNMLADRKMMIEKFFHGFADPATGPWYKQSEFADPIVAAIPFDPKGALAILREAGWTDSDEDGVLDKIIDGRKRDMRFTIITQNKQTERFLTVLKEDAKLAGVDINIKLMGWSTGGTMLEERKFEAADIGFGVGLVEFDPKPTWHSQSDRVGGANFTGYRDPQVDVWIDEARKIFDFPARVPLMRKIYRKIAEDLPAILLFNDKYTFYAYSTRVGRPKATYNYDIGVKYWWLKNPVEVAE